MNHQFKNSTKSLERCQKHTLLSIRGEKYYFVDSCTSPFCWCCHWRDCVWMDLRGMFHTSLLVLVPVILGKLLSAATFRAGKGDDETNTHECQQTTCTLNTWDHSSDPQIAHCLQGKQHQQALVLLLGITFQGAVLFESPIRLHRS